MAARPMTARTIEYRPVDDLDGLRALSNAKSHDQQGIRESVARFGFVEPIILDERTGRLVAGHGRLDELLGSQGDGEPPDGVEVDEQGLWLAPLVRGWSSVNDEEADAYALAANQLTIAGGWHHDTLLEQMERIQATPLRFDGLGFDREQLDVMLAELSTTNGDAMPPVEDRQWGLDKPTDTTVVFRFGDYSGKVSRDVYDKFVVQFEGIREQGAVMLDEVLVRWLSL